MTNYMLKIGWKILKFYQIVTEYLPKIQI